MAPRVPTIQQLGIGTVVTQKADTPFQRFSVPQEAFGTGAEAAAVGAALQAGSEVAAQIDDTRTTKALLDLEAEASQFKLDQEEAYARDRRLGDAEGLKEDIQKSWDGKRAELTKKYGVGNMRGSRQLSAQKYLDGVGQQTQSKAQNYELQQLEQNLAQQLDTKASNHASQGIAGFNDDTVIDGAAKGIESAMRASPLNSGKDAEVLDREIQAAQSAMHDSIVKRWLGRDDPERAEDALNRAVDKGEILPEQEAQLREAIRGRDDIVTAQNFADEMTAAHSLDDWDAATAEARKRFSGTQEAVAINELELRRKELTQRQSQQTRDARISANDKAHGDVENGVAPTPFEKLSPDEQDAINTTIGGRDAYDRTYENSVLGRPQTSNLDTLRELEDLWVNDRNQFVETDLTDYINRLTKGDQQAFQRKKDSLNKAALKTDAALRKEAAKSQRADAALRWAKQTGLMQSMGITTPANQADFSLALGEALDQVPDDQVLTPTELSQLMYGLLLEGTVSGTGFLGLGKDRTYGFKPTSPDGEFVLSEDDVQNKRALNSLAQTAQIPRDEVSAYAEDLIRLRVPVTTDTLGAVRHLRQDPDAEITQDRIIELIEEARRNAAGL